jgi:hypothetical protein
MTGSRFDEGKEFLLLNFVHIATEAHPASYPMSNEGFCR